jgi:hypothetical protein
VLPEPRLNEARPGKSVECRPASAGDVRISKAASRMPVFRNMAGAPEEVVDARFINPSLIKV